MQEQEQEDMGGHRHTYNVLWTSCCGCSMHMTIAVEEDEPRIGRFKQL